MVRLFANQGKILFLCNLKLVIVIVEAEDCLYYLLMKSWRVPCREGTNYEYFALLWRTQTRNKDGWMWEGLKLVWKSGENCEQSKKSRGDLWSVEDFGFPSPKQSHKHSVIHSQSQAIIRDSFALNPWPHRRAWTTPLPHPPGGASVMWWLTKIKCFTVIGGNSLIHSSLEK